MRHRFSLLAHAAILTGLAAAGCQFASDPADLKDSTTALPVASPAGATSTGATSTEIAVSVADLEAGVVAEIVAGSVDKSKAQGAGSAATRAKELRKLGSDSKIAIPSTQSFSPSPSSPAPSMSGNVSGIGSQGFKVSALGKAKKSAPAESQNILRNIRAVRVPGSAGPRLAMRGGTSSLNSSIRSRSSGARYKVSKRKQPPPPPPPDPSYERQDHGGTFAHAGTNPFTETEKDRHSTFAVDVDTASYTYARRFLQQGNRPTPASVRVEEWVNAFHYSYQQPRGKHPFAIQMEAGPSPLDQGRHILRVGVQGKKVSAKNRKPVHLTFLVDTSGSMRRADKLPLAQRALHHLVDNLSAKDSVALITYAGSTREVLAQTSIRHKTKIHQAIDSLMAGGGTAMGSGMEMAYRNANKVLSSGSVSRVIVLSDGDANIGRTSHSAILASIKGYTSEGIKLSTVGFGTGNYRDQLMEKLADAGDGNYSYIDSFKAAKKVFGTDLSGTLQVIAKDVKIQVEMNPRVVKSYRLLGYENRNIADQDFRNDKVDAGEIGAGHSVTALYEVVFHDTMLHDTMLHDTMLHDTMLDANTNIATVRVRYKKPRGTRATEVTRAFTQNLVRTRFSDLDRDTRFASALALAAEVLRGSPYVKDKSLQDAWALAAEAADGPFRSERLELVKLLDRTVRRGTVAVR